MSSSSASKAKKFNLKTVLDGLRGTNSSSQNRPDTEIEETLRSEHYHVTKTVRHGFPYQPTALAFDPVQHLLAIGNRTGSLRIIGQPGVDCHCSHDADVSIIQILFLVNEGALVTATNDDHLHLWNVRQKQPSIVHSLKFQREKVSKCHLPFQSKWLYVGTERGNVHVVNVESFTCSGYIINWNKAIELSRKTHPGPVVHLSDNPVDPNKLLIGFESGAIVFWDLKTKSAEFRYNSQEALRSISWHNEGKQFMCSHSDGSLSTWNVRTPQRPVSVTSPHAKIGSDGKWEMCKPIAKVEWRSTRTGESVVIFSGGMSYDRAARTPSITVMSGKSITVLEMEHNVVDFVSLCDTPWANDFQDPYAIVVLLQNDLVVIDLTSPGYPCFENPYPMDLHESPVTACQYYANCPMDIIPALYSTGKNQKKTGFSDKPWPIKGGSWGSSGTSYPEIIITGHADGSLKFWDASSVTLQFLYKLKTAKVFEKPKRPSEDKDDDPFAIQNILLCLESRIMCVAGPTHCLLFKFSKQETVVDIVALEFPIVYEIFDELDSPEFDFSKPSLTVVGQHSGSMGSYSSSASDNARSETMTSVKARGGTHRWGPGFLPDLVCVLCWVDGEPPGNITVMSINSSYGLLAFGNESGLAIVDYMQKACLLNLGTPDLYGSMDPYQRAPRSPRSKRAPGEVPLPGSDDCKSPTVEQSATNLPLTFASETSPSDLPVANSILHPGTAFPGMGGVMAPAPRPQHAVVKSVSLSQTTLARNAVGIIQQQPTTDGDIHSLLGKSLSLGCLGSVPHRPALHSAAEGLRVSQLSPRMSRTTHRTSSESLGPVDEDHFKAETRAEENGHQTVFDAPTAPPRNKHKNKQQLTFKKQVAPRATHEYNTACAMDTVPCHTEQQTGCAAMKVVGLLPRSVSELGHVSSKQLQESCDSQALLGPCSAIKFKCASAGDIAADKSCSTSQAWQGEHARTAFSDPENIGDSDTEAELRELLKKTSSDLDILQSDNIPVLEEKQPSEEPHKHRLVKTVEKTSKKKKKEVGDDRKLNAENTQQPIDGDQSDTFVTSSYLDQCERAVQFGSELPGVNTARQEDKEGCGQVGCVEVKQPVNNASFLTRVSLKMKSFSSRKYASQDDDRDISAAHKINQQKTQEKQPKYKINVLDLTDDAATCRHVVRKLYLSDVVQMRRALEKGESSSFSRSRSSSMSSLENVTKEAIQSLVFTDSYTRKQDNETSPCLWVGTSLGSVIVIALVLQPEQRLSQPVIVSPSGSLYRMKGAIVCMSFLDFRGGLIPALCEQWRDNRDNRDWSSKATSRQMSVCNSKPRISPTLSAEISSDRQFAILCSEKQARAISLPSQTCAFKVKVTETSFVVKADIVAMRESVCLMCYVANGHIVAFSVPSLKPLFDADFLPLTDYRVARTFSFSNNGHAMYLCSPTEIQKITYSAEISENLNEMLGELFLPKDTPEAPKQGFLKSLFGGGMATLDREELFGEASGKASKGLAKHIPGTGNLQQLQQQASGSSNEFSRTRLLVAERGEKLGDLEDKSAQMMNSAEQFASAAHSIMLKYKDKKWYQF
ncbi:hypothetical protein BsWGS_27811 [Bradybaena similaris]